MIFMTKHSVFLKQTDLTYVYDSDDDVIRRRRIRDKENRQQTKIMTRKRKRCDTCGVVIKNSSYVTFDVSSDDNTVDLLYVCLTCMIDEDYDSE
jgi:hypothetical protein